MAYKVVISGGSGLVGTRLTELLQQLGYQVAHLSRSQKENDSVLYYLWDVEAGQIEPGALDNATAIINLAGAGVADHRWTPTYKQKIINSRVAGTELLVREMAKMKQKPDVFVSASAIGYYGDNAGDKYRIEEAEPGSDFLAQVCQAWEAAALPAQAEHAIRTVIPRIGIVLTPRGGVLKEMHLPFRLGLGASLGSGDQIMSWIHLDDLCYAIIMMMQEEHFQGVYNAVAPQPVTNKAFSVQLAEVMHKPFFAPNIPSFAIKTALGQQRAGIALGGQKASAAKLQEAGYVFRYPHLTPALHNLLKT